MAYTQQNRLLSLSTPLGDDILLLIGFTGTEGLTRPSRFTLNTISEYDIEVESLIGQPINFDVELDDGSYRVFNGIVDKVIPKGLINQSLRRYQLKVITQLDMLKMRTDNRHFQNKSHRDIIKEVLSDHHVNVIDSTSGTYKTREYCVQYNESDFKFVHRLLKEEGINYYITHETGKHTVVLSDNKARYRGHNEPHIEYVDGDSSKRKFYNWHKEITFPTGQVAQRSFNYKRPLDPVKSGTSTVLSVNKAKQYEHYYYPALNNELQESNDESRRVMEAEENFHTLVTVNTNCRSLEAGQKFSFSRHVDDSECSNDYVITTIKYQAIDDTYLNQKVDTQNFESQLSCIPSDTMYRTGKKHPRPTAEGVHTAIVCGPAGEEIYTDKEGRVKVQFHWDRLNKRDENSSCWIRVAHQWAGAGYGSLYIPRIGQEVMVYFEDGDINKPLIFGGIYNGKNSTAQNLPANKTQTGMKSRSTKSADTAMFNELRFEDKKGQEDLYMQAQKDQKTIVKDSHMRVIGGDQNLSVGNNRFEAINQDRTSYVAEGSDSLQVEKDISYQSVDGSIYMHAAEFIEFITGDASLTMYADGSINANGKIIHIDGNGGVTINGGAGVSRNTLQPMKIENIYTTPAGPGASVPRMTVTPVKPESIAAQLINTSSREKLEEEALEYMVLNYDNLQKIMKSRPYCEELEHAIQQAQLAQHSYGRVPLSEDLQKAGWTETNINRLELNESSLVDFESGFKSKLYYNTLTDEYTLAYAGTDMTGMTPEEILETVKDAEASLTHGMFGNSEQYERAMGLARRVEEHAGDSKLNITGHSLGGGLATGAALFLDKEATVFNSSALTKTFAGIHNRDFEKVEGLVKNYVVDGEILNATQDKRILAELEIPTVPQLGPLSPKATVPIPNPMPAATSERIKVPKPKDQEYTSAESHGIAVAIKGLKEMQEKNCIGI